MLDNSEISVTIIAASIPALRVLFRDFQTTAKKQFGGKSHRGSTLTAPNRDYPSRTDRMQKSQSHDFKDDSSDREILDVDQNGKILRVDEIEVQYGSVSDVEGFEMKSKKSMS